VVAAVIGADGAEIAIVVDAPCAGSDDPARGRCGGASGEVTGCNSL
jgi:hypothetical protein